MSIGLFPLRRILLAAAVGLLAPLNAVLAATVRLNVGGQRVVDLASPIARIVIGSAGIVDAAVEDEDRVKLVGLHAGRTSLTIFTAAGGDGTAYSLVVDDPNEPRAVGQVGAAPPIAGASLTQALAAEPDLRGLQARMIDGHVILSGTVPDLLAHEKAASLASAYGSASVVDQTDIIGDQMVAVEIRFAAISATTVNELGFNFQSLGNGFQGFSASPNSLAFPALASAASSVATSGLPIAGAFNLLLQNSKTGITGILSALSGAGLTQLLAQPTLVVRSGEHASFLAGGEVPIPVPQGGTSNTVTITYHPYGVRLDVAPVVLSNHRISLLVSPEVSEIDNTNSLSIQGYNVPAFRKRSTSTTVELGDGESLVIAGLIYSNNSLSENRIPFLGDIPILGTFFKLTANNRERQELIVIATPHLVHPLQDDMLPPLPGEEISHYNPGAAAMILNTNTLDKALAHYGLTP